MGFCPNPLHTEGSFLVSVFVITGASSGLGEALALNLASPENTLHLVARRQERLESLAQRLSERGGIVRVYVLDVRDAETMENFALAILEKDGPPDFLVANAGIRGEGDGNGREAMEEILNTNVLGVLNTVHPFLPAMRRARKGQIAVVGSLAGYRGLLGGGGYCASKAALMAWTDSLRMELSCDGMTVSLVNPGYVTTEMTRGNSRPMPFVLSADEAARRILRGLEKRSPRIEFPLSIVLIVRILAILPCTLGDRLIKALSRDKNKNIPSGRTGNSVE